MMKRQRLLYIFRPGRLHQQILPLIVWMAAIAGVTMLFYRGSQRFEVVGIAQSQVAQVCSPVKWLAKDRLRSVIRQRHKRPAGGASLDDASNSASAATTMTRHTPNFSRLNAGSIPSLSKTGSG